MSTELNKEVVTFTMPKEDLAVILEGVELLMHTKHKSKVANSKELEIFNKLREPLMPFDYESFYGKPPLKGFVVTRGWGHLKFDKDAGLMTDDIVVDVDFLGVASSEKNAEIMVADDLLRLEGLGLYGEDDGIHHYIERIE